MTDEGKEEVVVDGATHTGGSADLEVPSPSVQAAQQEPKWFDSADLGDVELSDKDKEYNSLADYVKATQNLRSMISAKGIVPPADDATDEQKAEFKEKLREYVGDDMKTPPPEKPEDYKIELLDSAELPDDRKAQVLKSFYENGLDNETANKVMEIYAEQNAADVEEMKQAVADMRAETEETLRSEWGEKFQDRMTGVERAEEKHQGFAEMAKQAGLTGTREYIELMDSLFRSASEDITTAEGQVDNSSIQSQIDAIKSGAKYRNGNALERKDEVAKLEKLYKQLR